MTAEQEHHSKGFATKLSLFVSLCVVALLAVQNASLNTQVTNLQNQVENMNHQPQRELVQKEESVLPEQHALEFNPPPPSNIRSRERNLSSRGIVLVPEDYDGPLPESKLKEKLNTLQDNQLARGGRKLSSKKSSKRSGSSKSSKRCGSSRTMDSATTTLSGDSVSTARCEGTFL